MVHNYYQQRGGEDESVEQDFEVLTRHGHEVRFYSRHNDEIKNFNPLRKGLLFLEPSWSLQAYRDLTRTIREFQPEIVHFQNIFPLISPSAYYVSKKNRVPVVQTLRNYRLFCPGGLLLRNGTICKECLSLSLWQGVRYGCYRNSHIQTASVALMLAIHRILRTWEEIVDCYIALSDFSRQTFIMGGLPPSRIHVRSNFLVSDPGAGREHREYVLFVGRLSHEKGVTTLLEAWRNLPEVPLKIVGDGPARPWMEKHIHKWGLRGVRLTGTLSYAEVMQAMKRALFLIMPSVWHETFGRTIIEAYAAGVPVVASRLGAMSELVKDHTTGLLLLPGDIKDMVAKVKYAVDHPDELTRWGQEARHEYKRKYQAGEAYLRLIDIYQIAIEDNRRRKISN
jgi:glycosyltransferase involved in cell wall biosynthesis